MVSIANAYLKEVSRTHLLGGGVEETSYYPALQKLFEEVGIQLSPVVHCVISLKNQGAGLPDGGFFRSDQFVKQIDSRMLEGVIPSRGALEVKGPSEDVYEVMATDQIQRYVERYNHVLITNLREFLLVVRDRDGSPVQNEFFSISGSEDEFWVRSSQRMDKEVELRFIDFLKRVLTKFAPLSAPNDVAWYLASYAREALACINQSEAAELDELRAALSETLGIRFEGERAEHFFRSTLVQTIFYGLFSAWMVWNKETGGSNGKFDWQKAGWSLHLPMISAIFDAIVNPRQVGALNLKAILDWAADALNRVDGPSFFARYEKENAVLYFYEPFLEAFDPSLKKELGVWYTPPEVVKYMVEKVDRLLKDEFGLRDGFADKNVYVLDPCCGTGSYLVEIIGTILKNLAERGEDALVSQEVKTAVMERVFGFELMLAPYVVSHLQIRLALLHLGVPIRDDRNERVNVYLTNSLTGWELRDDVQKLLRHFPEFDDERRAADRVKQETPILVIIGNPPYNAYAGVSPDEEMGLVEVYKEGLVEKWGLKKFNIDDLYIRFFRLAERRIAEKTGRGIVCYISSFSYLDEASYVVMRQSLMKNFEKIVVDCLNGDSRRTGKTTPSGEPDPSIFSTEYNKEGIRVGTAIGSFIRKERVRQAGETVIYFRNFWGRAKRDELIESLTSDKKVFRYQKASPILENKFSFVPQQIESSYFKWPLVTDLGAVRPLNGPIERRGNSLIRHTEDVASFDVVRKYLDADVSNEQLASLEPRFMRSIGEFEAEKARQTILRRKPVYDKDKIQKYVFKPLDMRRAYLDPRLAPLFSRPNPSLLKISKIAGNGFLLSRDGADARDEGSPFYFSTSICDYTCISGNTRHFPWLLRENVSVAPNGKTSSQTSLSGKVLKNVDESNWNLSKKSRTYLGDLGVVGSDPEKEAYKLVWAHCLAIGYSQEYLSVNKDGIRYGWPRIPLPNTRELLKKSAALGLKVSGLLDPDVLVPGVTDSPIRQDLKTIARIQCTDQESVVPSRGDLRVTAGWGHGREVVMPGRGRAVERDYNKEEMEAFKATCLAEGISIKAYLHLLGPKTYDVYLNDKTYLANIPGNCWEYLIGGHQVLKKWLSYREEEVLGRSITVEEAREFAMNSRRIAALVMLNAELDKNYENVKNNSYAFDELPAD
jgi:hypothetical protein